MKTMRAIACLLLLALALGAQDQTHIVITGTSKYRLAVPDFAAQGVDAQLQSTFNSVLWNDLYQSAVVTMVGRSLYTAPTPAAESALSDAAFRTAWTGAPLSVQRLVFGTMQQVPGGGLVVSGYLYDVTQPPGAGRLLARRYANPATTAGARAIAHQFADDIITALGFGPGIATSQIAYISNRSGHEEVWTMDYDGSNKQQRTHLKANTYSPRISPDGKLLAFATNASGQWQIRILSLATNRLLPFPRFKGMSESPAWSPDGKKLAFASEMNGPNLDIYSINANGSGLKRLTHARGYDNLSPAWNPKPPPGSPGQIAFVSSRIGLPQIYIMDADGSHPQRLPLGGFAVSPSWAPNGLSLAFAWVRQGGGENSGAFDIYLWYFGSKKYVQLTHNEQRNDFPSWAPDNRHIVFESGPPYHTQLYTVAADGTVPAQLTTTGSNEMPNWSWH